MKTRIVVEIRNGMVSKVLSSRGEVEVMVLNYDHLVPSNDMGRMMAGELTDPLWQPAEILPALLNL